MKIKALDVQNNYLLFYSFIYLFFFDERLLHTAMY